MNWNFNNMAPKKSTTKGKYIATVVHENPSNSNNNNSSVQDNEVIDREIGSLESLASSMAAIDPNILGSLRGYGPSNSAGQIPKFDPKTQEWHTFNLSLQHYLLINNLLNQLKNTDIANENNLALFLAISNCLTREALEITKMKP